MGAGRTPHPCPRGVHTVPPLSSHSFWFFKFLVLVGITVGAFYIPDGAFTSGEELPVLSLAPLHGIKPRAVPPALTRPVLS